MKQLLVPVPKCVWTENRVSRDRGFASARSRSRQELDHYQPVRKLPALRPCPRHLRAVFRNLAELFLVRSEDGSCDGGRFVAFGKMKTYTRGSIDVAVVRQHRGCSSDGRGTVSWLWNL